MASQLVVVRCTLLWSIPLGVEPSRVVGRHVEPLVLDCLGHTWVADGTRNEAGRLLYRLACASGRRPGAGGL